MCIRDSLDTNGFDINFDANKYLTFANTSSAGQIYHTGSHFYIWNGTGSTNVHGDTVSLKSKTGNENMLRGVLNGTVELYYNNTKRFETLSSGAAVTGDFGVGTVSPNNNSGYNTLTLNSSTNGGVLAFSQNDSRKGLIYTESNGDLKFQTESGKHMRFATGGTTNRLIITTTGQVQIPNDGQELALGGSQDLKLYHSGQHSFIDEVGQGSLYIRNGTVSSVVCHTNAAVELYYDCLLYTSPSPRDS